MTSQGRGRIASRRLTQLIVTAILALVAPLLTTATIAPAHASPVLYRPQPDRNAEWDGAPNNGGFTADSINNIGTNYRYFVLNKTTYGGAIQDQLPDVNAIAAAGAQNGAGTKVLAYYMSTRWSEWGWDDLAPYSSTFPQGTAWYLRDYQGNPIPYYGETDPGHTDIKGYLVDTSNPAYQTWLVTTIRQWLLEANFAGLALDSTNIVLGTTLPTPAISDGVHTWNEMLCGPGTYTGDCPGIVHMNQGLTTLVRKVAAAVHAMGLILAYNGIAPSAPRGPSRNVGLLDYADIAHNENFCFGSADPSTYHIINPMTDWQIMDEQATRGKKIFEVTGWNTQAYNDRWGRYCTVEFLLGWHPGSTYFVYHQNSSHQIDASPASPEVNLNLGNPTGPRTNQNGAFTRTFQNGYVAMNTSFATKTFQTPVAMTLFANGQAVTSFAAHTWICLPAHTAMMFLYNSFLY